MALNHAVWTHGTSIQVEEARNEPRPVTVNRQGSGTYLQGSLSAATNRWCHFAIPTPVMVSDKRLKVDSAILAFVANPAVSVKDMHVFDGVARISQHNNINLSGDHPFERFNVVDDSGEHPSVNQGIGISVNISFGIDNQGIWFRGAGVDFVDP
jgi:hypothetical protein